MAEDGAEVVVSENQSLKRTRRMTAVLEGILADEGALSGKDLLLS